MDCDTLPPYELHFDIEKVKQTYETYHENHPGLTLVIGHPFENQEFLTAILIEQALIWEIFEKHGLEHHLILYQPDQIHATILELAGQHDESQIEQPQLTENEFKKSKKGESIDIDFTVEWIKQTDPFEVELGKGVLSEDHKDQTIRITPNGQIVMKGRAKERELLAKIRGEFEDKAHILHKYTREDDEFFFVVGYLSSDSALNEPKFLQELSLHLKSRREVIKLSMRVNEVSVIHYQHRTLDTKTCLKERKFTLKKDPKITSIFNDFVSDSNK